MHFVHADDVDVARLQMRQHRAQELWRHLEMVVRLERIAAARAHMMQHEDGADAGKDRPQHKMRAGEIQRSQSGTDNGVAELLHCGRWLADRKFIQVVNEGPLNKLLFMPATATLGASVISGLTAPQGFVFSLCFRVSRFAVPALRHNRAGEKQRAKAALESDSCWRSSRGTSNARSFQVE